MSEFNDILQHLDDLVRLDAGNQKIVQSIQWDHLIIKVAKAIRSKNSFVAETAILILNNTKFIEIINNAKDDGECNTNNNK